jgi:catalase
VPTGRVAYEPNSLAPEAPRESLKRGFATSARPVEGGMVRVRSDSFSDHYSQARLFFKSITPPEQKTPDQCFDIRTVEVGNRGGPAKNVGTSFVN